MIYSALKNTFFFLSSLMIYSTNSNVEQVVCPANRINICLLDFEFVCTEERMCWYEYL